MKHPVPEAPRLLTTGATCGVGNAMAMALHAAVVVVCGRLAG
ncbi:MAG: hypothetical protein WCE30_03475 [Mycobacterium sp.]